MAKELHLKSDTDIKIEEVKEEQTIPESDAVKAKKSGGLFGDPIVEL